MAHAQATLRYARVSPRKARPVADLIRGKQVPIALAMLSNTPRSAAKIIEKILRSAVANAEQKNLEDPEELIVSKAFVDGGPILKRFRARSMGRANSIQKRTSHITIVVGATNKAVQAAKA